MLLLRARKRSPWHGLPAHVWCIRSKTDRISRAIQHLLSHHIANTGRMPVPRVSGPASIGYTTWVRRREMKHRLFRLVSAASLLLCIAICGIWLRSYSTKDWVSKDDGNTHIYQIVSYRGAMMLQCESCDSGVLDHFSRIPTFQSEAVRPERGFFDDYLSFDAHIWHKARWIGFGVVREPCFDGIIYAAVIPWWFVGLCGLGMSVTLWKKSRCPARVGRLCPQCGYDLRATPHRCPECGTRPTKAAQ
jgi:hypothetical protein